jgi:hypothetical protein
LQEKREYRAIYSSEENINLELKEDAQGLIASKIELKEGGETPQ